MDPMARANELIEVTQSLTAVIDRESELLKDLRVKEIGLLQQEKDSLAGLYEVRMREIMQEPNLLKTVDPTVRLQLRAASETFESSAQRNANALRAAMEMNTRMVNAIANVASGQEVQPSGYAANGAAPGYIAQRGMTVRPMTLNQEF